MPESTNEAPPIVQTKPDWRDEFKFDRRQQLEIQFAQTYVAEYNHGTTGHNQLVLIAQMSNLLDYLWKR